MASVHDVAAYILQKHGSMSAMKLQKLVYYSQAWALVWDEKPLFPERIEAWSNGPVAPALFSEHKGRFLMSEWPRGDAAALTREERETVDAVLDYYGDKPAQWLSDLTHAEAPWSEARKGLPESKRGRREITHAAMAEYYGSLPPDS